MKNTFVTAVLSILLMSIASFSHANKNQSTAITQPIPINEIVGYSTYPVIVKTLISNALKLSQMNLTYMYGSADPKNKGMDCSGTIYYLLTESKLPDVPRDADELFNWVKNDGKLYLVSNNDVNSLKFLKPGDLLFWSGTYATTHSISHVMLYLGKNKKGEQLMFGSSDGRTYQGKKMWGVSVFDFKLPDAKEKKKFVGYGCIPKLTCN
jgi:hypothetical protein